MRIAKVRPADAPAIWRALGWMLLARVVLLAGGFGAARRLLNLRTLEQVEREPGARPVLAPRALRDVRVALRLLEPKLLHVTCLPRAIVVERTLRAHGIEGELVLGCKTDEGFKAHAWVELDGHPVGFGEDGARAWKPLARFTSARAPRTVRA